MNRYKSIILIIAIIAVIAAPLIGSTANSFDVKTDKLSGAVILYIGSPSAIVNNKDAPVDDTDLSAAPFIMGGKTYIPLRFVSENMKADVSWDNKTKTAVIKYGAQVARFTVGDSFFTLDGTRIDAGAKAMLVNGRTYVPIRALAESVFKKEVFWHQNLIVISDVKDIFDAEKDKGAIFDLIARIEQIPVVGTKERLVAILSEKAQQYENYPAAPSLRLEAAESQDAGSMEKAAAREGDYSATNIQVAGVDEGDIIKTDGEYIYQVNMNKIVIVKAYPAGDMKIASEIEFDRSDMLNPRLYPAEVYVDGDVLVVIGNIWDYKTYTKAIVYDIKDKANVKEIREIALEGNYLSSRKIGDCMYIVSNQYMNMYPFLRAAPAEFEDAIPEYMDSAAGGGLVKVDLADMRYFPKDMDMSHTFIAGFKISEPGTPADVTSYLGSGQIIYCGKENLYIAKPVYNYYGYNSTETTEIYRFAIEGGKVAFERKGTVKGRPLNQFSMDEYAGYFRIATTENNFSSGDMTNSLYVLSARSLELTGKIENMAPGEMIYSVRFMGEKGYIVTFRTVDPLFAIDLSDPARPKVLGELKIPGFSQYLHPYDENHIIGFGKDTDVVLENWNGHITERVIETGMKMALFDVSDPTAPKEKFSTKVGGRGTFSEILYNHRALLFSKEKNLIAFPVTIYKQSGREFDYGKIEFQGAIIYGLGLSSGFTLKGKISHTDVRQDYYSYYDYEKEVERILYIGDVLYTTSKGMIKASDMNSLREIKSVEIKTY